MDHDLLRAMLAGRPAKRAPLDSIPFPRAKLRELYEHVQRTHDKKGGMGAWSARLALARFVEETVPACAGKTYTFDSDNILCPVIHITSDCPDIPAVGRRMNNGRRAAQVWEIPAEHRLRVMELMDADEASTCMTRFELWDYVARAVGAEHSLSSTQSVIICTPSWFGVVRCMTEEEESEAEKVAG
jgi:hypothetical protein